MFFDSENSNDCFDTLERLVLTLASKASEQSQQICCYHIMILVSGLVSPL
jgi:hypothetical protein